MQAEIDVLTIGNAIVDVIAKVDDAFVQKNGLVKGSMNLIDEARAEALYASMGPAIEISGGSAGNTAAGVASFGGKAAYFGKVKADQLGKIYAHDMRAQGVQFDSKPATDGPATARSFILVTPEGERTMNTYLGRLRAFDHGRCRRENRLCCQGHLHGRLSLGQAGSQGSLQAGRENCPQGWQAHFNHAFRFILRRAPS